MVFITILEMCKQEKNLTCEKENSASKNDQEVTDRETPRKRMFNEEKSATEEDKFPQKNQRVYKSDSITGDKVLLAVAMEVSDKWSEVGVSLGIGYKILQSTIGNLGTSAPDHRKAFLMLQEWKSRAAESFTYNTLASALEENGLNSCALKFCYT